MAMQMQSLLATNGSGMTRMSLPSGFMPRLEKRGSLRVSCTAGGPNEEKTEVTPPPVTSYTPSTSNPTPMPTYTPPPKKADPTFNDVLNFSGSGPERINGRLAMIGFTAALAVELSKGVDLFSQISHGGTQWFLGTSILLTVASLVPLFKGENPESKTDGLMNAKAELWNGRVAMLGLIGLAVTEYIIGGALV